MVRIHSADRLQVLLPPVGALKGWEVAESSQVCIIHRGNCWLGRLRSTWLLPDSPWSSAGAPSQPQPPVVPVPVEPYPPAPLTVASRLSTSTTGGVRMRSRMSWAMRSPRFTADAPQDSAKIKVAPLLHGTLLQCTRACCRACPLSTCRRSAAERECAAWLQLLKAASAQTTAAGLRRTCKVLRAMVEQHHADFPPVVLIHHACSSRNAVLHSQPCSQLPHTLSSRPPPRTLQKHDGMLVCSPERGATRA